MWYVIQCKSGDEEKVTKLLRSRLSAGMYDDMFIPIYEEVRRGSGGYTIHFRRLFPGYIFVETNRPEKLYDAMKKVPDFTRMLGVERDEEDSAFYHDDADSDDGREASNVKLFSAVDSADEEFLRTILDDGVVHISYISMVNKRVDKVIGPLAKYRNHISKLDIPHRRAIVEMEVFGKRRKVRFSLCMEGDPRLPWLNDLMEDSEAFGTQNGQKPLDDIVPDIGIYPGDRVVDTTGIFGDYEFVVDRVDSKRRILYTQIDILGGMRKIELFADNMRVVED